MLIKPDLPDEAIIESMRAQYGIMARDLEFLPVGNDARAWAFRVSGNSADYFLKLHKGGPRLAGLLVSHHLQQSGVANVVAPMPNKAGELYAQLAEYSLVLFHWITGISCWGRRLTARQLRHWGRLMRAIHAAEINRDLARIIPHEDYRTKWLDRLQKVEQTMA